MRIISIHIPDKLFQDMSAFTEALHISRTKYICDAIERMNKEMMNNICSKQLQKASLLVRKESIKINSEFNEIEHEPEA